MSLNDGIYIIASSISRNPVLDLEGGNNPIANIIGYTKHGGENQQWNVIALRPGVYSLESVFGNTWLTAPVDGSVAQIDSSRYDPIYNEATRWKITDAGGGSYQIESVQFPGKVIDLEGSNSADLTRAILYPNHQAPNQIWQFIPVAK
ncbi:carbohydrate-binding module family 13 [Trichoderma ceciliae]